MEIQTIKELIQKCTSKAEVCRLLGWSDGGYGAKRLNKIILENNLDISHFKPNTSHLRIKYPKVEKVCPICLEKFETQLGHPKELTTCSKSCSNTYYRSGSNNGNYKEDRSDLKSKQHLYRPQFDNSELYCRRCGYNEYICSVDIHHIDEDRNNNDRSNLIPLCKNCHQGLHNKKWDISSIRV